MKSNSMTIGPVRLVGALSVVAVLTMSACSSSGSAVNDASQSTKGDAPTITDGDVAVASKFVGGGTGKADPSLRPVKVGLIANVEGPTAQPYLADTADDAAKLINERLGGVGGGHPLEFVRCTFGGSAQQGQLCGQEFANNPDISFVYFPGGTVGGPQLHAANDGAKAYLCTLASPGDASADNLFCTSGGPLAAGAMITYIDTVVKAKSVALISIDDPTLAAISKQVAGLFDAVNIPVKVGLAPAGATDVTSTVLASGAKTADVTMLLLPTASTCIPVVKALKALAITKPVVALQQCSEQSVVDATGGIPEFTYYDYGPSIHLKSPEMDVYRHVVGAYGTEEGATAPQVFGDGLLVAKLINDLGIDNLTTASVSAKLAKFTGPTFLGDSKLSFGNKPLTSVGSLRARFYSYGDGKWTDATDGEWLQLAQAGS